MLKRIVTSTALFGLLSGMAYAGEVEVKIINNTSGNYFTPLLVTTHAKSTSLYGVGEEASSSLQMMAEGGDISGLVSDLGEVDAFIVENPAAELLAPGQSTMATVESDKDHSLLSIAAMILPTNDGFVALNGWEIPNKKGIYKVNLNAYDAGTEANDEIVNGGGAVGTPGIPADPGAHAGTGATGVSASVEGFVHVHRGILGDHNATGGVSDLESGTHRWLNPIATVMVTVK